MSTLDITIDGDDALSYVRDMVVQSDGELTPIRLLVGGGHSGYGLYIASVDYPCEGAIFLQSMKEPPLPLEQEPVGEFVNDAEFGHIDLVPYHGEPMVDGQAVYAAPISAIPVMKMMVDALEFLDKEWRELNEAQLGLQGEDNNRFYTPQNVKVAIAAGQQYLKENGK